jgi:hypothetical protein
MVGPRQSNRSNAFACAADLSRLTTTAPDRSRSGVKRIPKQAVTLAQSDPGAYEKTDLGGLSTVASASRSPSLKARRGDASFSSFSARMLQEEGPETPGPGAYTTPPPPVAGGDLGASAFRSKRVQRPQSRQEKTPPPGAYQKIGSPVPPGGGATSAFRSKADRIGKPRATTNGDLGPGRYDPRVAEEALRRKPPAGPIGAESFPFSSTSRRD